MLRITFLGFGSNSVHSVTERDFRDIINFSSSSAGYFSSCTDSLNGKNDSGFLGLH